MKNVLIHALFAEIRKLKFTKEFNVFAFQLSYAKFKKCSIMTTLKCLKLNILYFMQ